MSQKNITSYTTFTFKDDYWKLNDLAQQEVLRDMLEALQPVSPMTAFYQVFPARSEFDFFAWSSVLYEDVTSPDKFFKAMAKAISPYRQYVDSNLVLCGMTNPSVYRKSSKPSTQEINPFEDKRQPYFVIYPFSKTPNWYLMPREHRQLLMNGHIKLGREYPAIKQLLLYSVGVQDQEFIVAYEMEDLAMFSDLVMKLRSTIARDYTLLDTPIITGTLRSIDELVDIFSK